MSAREKTEEELVVTIPTRALKGKGGTKQFEMSAPYVGEVPLIEQTEKQRNSNRFRTTD